MTQISYNYMEQSSSWEAKKSSATQIPALFGTQKFITAFTEACHMSVS